MEAVISGSEVKRLYFPGKGIVEFQACEIDSEGHGSATDAMGRKWNFTGFTDVSSATAGDEKSDNDQ